MKKINYIVLLLIGSMLTACFDEDETLIADIESTSNFVTFNNGSQSFSAVSDGEEYDFLIPIAVKGPNMDNVSGPVTATISVDPASTAVEGTHFRLDSRQITLDPDNNYAGNLPITMLTAGIDAPLDENPTLILNIATATGDASVIAGGKPLNISFLYGCFSNLGGTWLSLGHTWQPNCDGNAVPVEVTVTPTGNAGEYVVSTITDLYFGGDPCQPADICGTINDVCNKILVSTGPSGCNYGIETSGTGSVSDDGNTITMKVYNNATASEQDIVLERN